VLLHSRTLSKRALLSSLGSGAHRIIVCVNMFGEGFDLPSVKVAALNSWVLPDNASRTVLEEVLTSSL